MRERSKALEGQAIYVHADGQNQELVISPQVLKVQDYSLDRMRDEDLDFLLPFQPFLVEKGLRSLDDQEFQRTMVTSVREVSAYFQDAHDSQRLSDMQIEKLMECHETILKAFLRSQSNERKEEAEKIMARGYVFRGSMPTRMAREEGIAEGRREGREEGRLEGIREGRAEGRLEGHAKGYAEGCEKMLKENAFSMFLQHFALETVQAALRISKQKAQAYYQEFFMNKDAIQEKFQREDNFSR